MGIIDTHVHSWDMSATHHEWLDDRPDLPRKARLPNKAARRRAGVTGVLLVEAGAVKTDAAAERDLMLKLVEDDGDVLGIVSPSELEEDSGRAQGSVDAVRGVRVNIRAMTTNVAAESIVRAVRRAAASARAVEVLCTAGGLAAVAAAARRTPGHSIVIDHLGGPPARSGRNSGAMGDWREGMLALSRTRDVVVKISGQTSSNPLLDTVRWVVDEFGTARCMLGSDWPISENARYGTWFEQVDEAVGGLDVDISHATACRTYRLPPMSLDLK